MDSAFSTHPAMIPAEGEERLEFCIQGSLSFDETWRPRIQLVQQHRNYIPSSSEVGSCKRCPGANKPCKRTLGAMHWVLLQKKSKHPTPATPRESTLDVGSHVFSTRTCSLHGYRFE